MCTSCWALRPYLHCPDALQKHCVACWHNLQYDILNEWICKDGRIPMDMKFQDPEHEFRALGEKW